MLFLEYPKCSTCKKAKKWLDEHGIAYDDRHIVEENPTQEELKTWYEKSGLPLKRFFNTSGMKYRELKLKDRLPEMSEEEQIEILASDGMLVKRPLVIDDDFILIGFKEQQWKETFDEEK
ncbi:MAG TPA: arsenate reductase family protein [Candidatus Anaerostipes excrementavium]|uniref:Arsenate reductase family protein n=1 Tax=Candidatus Anaerostipes excrementavium TaxID=2838463 RepID=A0A9D1WU00_9FIRM|nr:arsenate reductase family protein [uncultured Anaerostipes sp.]HIX67129.1 arsenate reductase family protein [Candidatus Anaerostipes excrementavium]